MVGAQKAAFGGDTAAPRWYSMDILPAGSAWTQFTASKL